MKIVFFYSIIFASYLTINVASVSVSGPDLTTCPIDKTCSPSTCVSFNNTACPPENNTYDYAASISAMECNPNIVQSNLTLCLNRTLLNVFAKGIGNGVKAVYCTDKYLVIHTNDVPNHQLNLFRIPHPPAGGNDSSIPYSEKCVTRYNSPQYFIYKIPLYPVDLGVSSLDNNKDYFTCENNVLPNGIPLPGEGAVGISVSGIPFKCAFNQVGYPSWIECSLDDCNGHVPQGDGYHYHGDPFNCMYNASDYGSTTSHPPIIGFSLDGFYIYGRYLDANAPGYSVPLDICGGHSHDSYGYHYHSQVLQNTVTERNQQAPYGSSYTAYYAGVYQCWRGNITNYPGFWNGVSGSTNLANRDDYPNIQPACGMNNWYAESNIIFQLKPPTTTTKKTTTTTRTTLTTTTRITTTTRSTTTTTRTTTTTTRSTTTTRTTTTTTRSTTTTRPTTTTTRTTTTTTRSTTSTTRTTTTTTRTTTTTTRTTTTTTRSTTTTTRTTTTTTRSTTTTTRTTTTTTTRTTTTTTRSTTTTTRTTTTTTTRSTTTTTRPTTTTTSTRPLSTTTTARPATTTTTC